MRSFTGLRKPALLVLAVLLACASAALAQAIADGQDGKGRDWRTWTSVEGAEINAYLKDVRPEGIVIVRRDGREFVAPFSRFSEEDRAYVLEWLQGQTVSANKFRELDLNKVELPNRHTIANVENVRQRSGEPPEAAAIKTVLAFKEIAFDPRLPEALSARKRQEDIAISPRDLVNALAQLPIEAEILTAATQGPENWPANLKAIQTVVSWDLPVILVYRPHIEPETPEEIVVVTGYDQRNFHVLEPAGSRSTMRLDTRTLDQQFVYALILFQTADPTEILTTAKTEARPPSPGFLSRLSTVIMEVPEFEPEILATSLQEQGIQASMRDVNRSDLQSQLGQTRSFARTGGLPLIDASLDRGRVVVIPQTLETGAGFTLIYGRVNDDFQAVEFAPDRTFQRAPVSRADIARRWLTREDRTYHLYVIDIEVPPENSPPLPPGGRPPADEPPPPRR